MKSKIKYDQRGIAHLGLIVIVVVFLAVGYAVYWRFQSANNQSGTTQQSEQLDPEAAAQEAEAALDASSSSVEELENAEKTQEQDNVDL